MTYWVGAGFGLFAFVVGAVWFRMLEFSRAGAVLASYFVGLGLAVLFGFAPQEPLREMAVGALLLLVPAGVGGAAVICWPDGTFATRWLDMQPVIRRGRR